MSRGRYAPSPTGDLHLGNARTAVVAWWRARSAGSSFVMRVEDLDDPRTVPAAVTGNLEELRWLGLDWDEGPDVGGTHAPYRQSERHALYRSKLGQLEEQGLLFECYLSRRDLRELSSAPHGAAPVYGERERRLNERIRARKRAEGKSPSVRLRVPATEVRFEDVVYGPQHFDAQRDVGDVVLRRADDAWAYQFAVVVDDAAMDIDEVVRGADLLASTAAQLLVFRALGHFAPTYLHVPLLLDEEGERLAKRKGSLTLSSLRKQGIPPQRVLGLLAFTLGFLERPQVIAASDLLQLGSLESLIREAYRLRREDLDWLKGG